MGPLPLPAMAAWCLCACLPLAPHAIVKPQEPVVKPEQKPGAAKPNRLAKESSPYLRQHQDNPVDWYPWGAAALERAKKEDKPIFLSIGYAACHWCHVMAAESFADPAIASVLNENFVCIKVDREERPDIDEIYMAALQAMGQQGGWPLSAWLTPDGRPFYGGTYFPPEDAHGRPAFRRVLETLAKAWREKKNDVNAQADELAQHLRDVLAPKLVAGEPGPASLAEVLTQSKQRFDEVNAGFAYAPHWAPKFPPASELQALLRLPDAKALDIVQRTLAAMRRGGIYDQLGGGFHRYSTDRQWLVPHFEKMLYDNALLVPCYLDAFARTGDADHAVVARETLDYLLREMQHERGGFYSSQDAQSEGVEGKFFVWSKAEFDAVLGAELDDLGELARAHFGVTADGNWEHTNVLVLAQPAEALAAGKELAEVKTRLQQARSRLLAARDKRVHPGTDDKILCAWNGLALTALAAGYRHLGDARYLDAARALAGFLLDEMVVDGRCRRSWHGGTARHQGYLEDHAMLADGLVSLFEVDPDPRWLEQSRNLLQNVREHFRAEDGGFYATADDHEQLLARSKSAVESSTPSGMAAAVRACLRAGLLLGDEKLYEMGVGGLRANHRLLVNSPAACPALVVALQFHVADPQEIVIAGEPGDPRTQALLTAAWRAFPDHHVVALVHEGNRKALVALSKVFDGKEPVNGAPAAYVCRRGVCAAPVTDPAKLLVRK
ncbi:MAG TPA: thioredoxin domain-containing protein [Planctomycetota bacterium]|nr:thioredoxin domain-containing protein [Planctomycetota bacterium]